MTPETNQTVTKERVAPETDASRAVLEGWRREEKPLMDALSGLGMPSIDVPLVSATAAQLMELSDKLKAKGEELKAKGEELLRTSDIIDSLAVTRGDIENIEAIEARE